MASANARPSRSDGARGLSLRAKWTASILAVTLAPMLVGGFVVLRLQREGLATASRELEAAIVDEAAGRVERALEGAAGVAASAGAELDADDAPADVRLKRITETAARLPTVRALSFFDASGGFVDALVVRDEGDAGLRTPPTREGFEVLAGASGAAPVLRVARRAPGPTAGWVVVTLSREALAEELRGLSLARFGVPDRLVLIDDRGLAFVGGADPPGTRPALLEALPGARPPFTAPLVLTAELDDHGVAMVGTLRTLPALHAAVGVERPAAEAFATLARTRGALLDGLLLFTTLAAAIGTTLARRSLAPIESLLRLVQRYGRRELDARSSVRTRDELETLGTALERMADELASSDAELARRARIEADLARYLPADVARSIDGERRLALGGERRPVTVLFADVVAFSGFAETTSPERAVAFLNELFTLLSEIVFRHHGTIDKFIGDCVMALFDELPGEPAPALRALRAAEDMHRFVASTRERWKTDHGFAVRLGIGVAAGEALVGNLGSELRMEYTAIGDVVNVAARLETLARPEQTLTTGTVAAACPELEFASLGEHPIRGRAAALEVFEVVS